MDKKKYKVYAPIDWIQGHLRYGHLEGEIELSDEEVKKIKDNPSRLEHLYLDELDLIVDDWELDNRGTVYKVKMEELKDEV